MLDVYLPSPISLIFSSSLSPTGSCCEPNCAVLACCVDLRRGLDRVYVVRAFPDPEPVAANLPALPPQVLKSAGGLVPVDLGLLGVVIGLAMHMASE